MINLIFLYFLLEHKNEELQLLWKKIEIYQSFQIHIHKGNN